MVAAATDGEGVRATAAVVLFIKGGLRSEEGDTRLLLLASGGNGEVVVFVVVVVRCFQISTTLGRLVGTEAVLPAPGDEAAALLMLRLGVAGVELLLLFCLLICSQTLATRWVCVLLLLGECISRLSGGGGGKLPLAVGLCSFCEVVFVPGLPIVAGTIVRSLSLLLVLVRRW